MISAGELNKQIELQSKGTDRGEDGSIPKAYTTFATVWAKIDPIAGREFWNGQQVNSEITHNIIIRYRSGLSPDMRVKFGSRYFEVLFYRDPKEYNEEFVLRCKEVITGG